MTEAPDFFENYRRDDGGEEFLETRLSRKQLVDDNVWRPMVVQHVYDCGSAGTTLDRLLAAGVAKSWWQDTASKHFGEKMRVAFSTGLIFVPVYPGVSTLRHIRLVHPAFVSVAFQNTVLERDNVRTRKQMMAQLYVEQQND